MIGERAMAAPVTSDGAAAVLIELDGRIAATGFSEDSTTGVTGIALARYLG